MNRNRAVCIQPFLMAEGYVIFDVAIGDEKYNWKGKYFVGMTISANNSRFYVILSLVHIVFFFFIFSRRDSSHGYRTYSVPRLGNTRT